MKCKTWILMCYWAGVMQATTMQPNTQNHIIVSVPPDSGTYMAGEPVKIILHWDNQGDETYRLPIRARDIHLVRLFIRGEGLDDKTPARIRSFGGGITSFANENKLAPHTSRDSVVFLNDYLAPIPPGSYTLSMLFDNFPPLQTTVHVSPETPDGVARLRERLATQWETIRFALEQYHGEALAAKREIVLTEHADALSFQIRLFELKDLYRIDYYDELMLIDTLVASREPDAIRALREYMLDDPTPHNYARNHLMVALREAGVKEWTGEIYDFIAPYLDEIEMAISYSICD